MENRIPIDELFRNGLAHGKEQMNLGAWANMERMLDGKNPYAKEKSNRKPWIYFITSILLLAGMLTAGYFGKTNSNSISSGMQTNQLANASNTSAKIAPQPSNNNTISNSSHPTTLENQIKKTTSQKTNIHDEDIVTRTQTEKKKVPTKNVVLRSNPTSTNISEFSASTNENIAHKEVIKGKHSTSILASSNKSKPNSIIPSHTPTEIEGSSNAMAKMDNADVHTKYDNSTFNKKDSMAQYIVSEKVARRRDGSVKLIEYDTINKSKQAIETTAKVERSNLKDEATSSHSNMENIFQSSNPRYVKVSKEEEEKMTTSQEPITRKKIQLETRNNNNNIAHTSSSITPPTDNGKSKEYHTSFFQDMNKFTRDTYHKLITASIGLFHMKIPIYSGMTVGINKSILNATHNFGGFQIGSTGLIPINDYLSLLTEAKFFYRNNSGYTIADIYSNILNTSVDQVSLQNQNKYIYNYQKDSLVKTYNFKHFMSLELPILLQANYRSFALYGGANVAYNFKLNIKEIDRKYVIDQTDTVDKSVTYNFPTSQGQQYARNDFAKRFGIGYVFGGSYSFNPNLYVDLRLTQNVWDNTKTNAAKEISNGFFKVPYIQFSLGYRFRKFTPNN